MSLFSISIRGIGYYSVILSVIIFGVLNPQSDIQVNAQEIKPPQNFVIDYTDYNKILKGLVLSKGPSSRKAPPKVSPPVGTRISFVNKKITRLESSRVMFHILTKEDKKTISLVRQALEALPTHIPLNNFNKDEQLAYWLNLRNLTVLGAISDAYPIMKLKNFWRKLESNKKLNVAGQIMSITDIETLVITNWPNVNVIYGFYNGSIGGPSILNQAFTGQSVWKDLEKNAKEFTNSLRGIQFRKKTTKLSDFYSRYPVLFPNFKNDIQNHIRVNLKPKLVEKMDETTRLKISINDWAIADLMGGRLGLSSAGSIGPMPQGTILQGQNSNAMVVAMMKKEMPFIALQKYPAHVQVYLKGMLKRRIETPGKVTIEEVEGNKSDLPAPKKKKKKKKN